MNNTVQRQAFSLMELLAVVVILGVIAAVVIPRITDSTNQSKIAATANNFKILVNACKMYRVEHGEWPGDVARRRFPTVLESYLVPTDNPFLEECPLGGVYDWQGWGSPPFLTVHGSWTADERRAVDAILDDGDLSTGSVQSSGGTIKYLCY